MEEIKTRITFQQVNETEINVLKDGEIVGSIWSYSNDKQHYPYNEKQGYSAIEPREDVQICGFTTSSVVWDCGIFKGKKDLVVDFTSKENVSTNKEIVKQKWEYKLVEMKLPLNNNTLNMFGYEGWELVTYNHNPNDEYRYMFKRPRND